MHGLRFVLFSSWREVFIKSLGPRVFLERINVYLLIGGPFNPYFQGGVSQLMTMTYLCPKNVLSHVFYD